MSENGTVARIRQRADRRCRKWSLMEPPQVTDDMNYLHWRGGVPTRNVDRADADRQPGLATTERNTPMITRVALSLVALLVVAAGLATTRPALAQGQARYYWAGETAQGEWIELEATATAGGWAVSAVRLSGAVVKCARTSEDLDLSSLVFPTDTEIGSGPFTIARLTAGDSQVALVVDGQVTGGQLDATVTVYWSRLYYPTERAAAPRGERCRAVVPATLELFAID
jgi:hypothetical protein